MPNNNYFAQANYSRHPFLRLGLSIIFVTLLTGFSTDAFGQVAIQLSQIGQEINKNRIGKLYVIKAIGEQLFVGTRAGLWAISEGGKKVNKVEDVEVSVYDIEEVGERFFIGTPTGLLIVGKNHEEQTWVKDIKESTYRIKIFDEQVFVGTRVGLWIVSKDGKEYKRLKGIEESVYDIEGAGGRFFVGTSTGLLIINKDDELNSRAKVFGAKVYKIRTVGDQIFVGTEKSLLIVSKDGTVQREVENVRGPVFDIETVGEQIFVSTKSGLWIISKDGTVQREVKSVKGPVSDIKKFGENIFFIASDEIFRLDPTVSIKSELVPTGWPLLVNSFLPSNWLPTGKTQAKAFYSNEKGDDPYDETIPREFSFASADSDTVPPGDKFSPQEHFRYEIGWGRNEVQYWVKDGWGNTFKSPKVIYYGFPVQYFIAVLLFIIPAIFVLGCFALAPNIAFCHSAIMNPWLRKYLSLGSVPLLLSVFPSLRRHILRRYSSSVERDTDFKDWKGRFVYPEQEFLPENFGKKLDSERRLLLTGQSGIGKTSYFKHLTAHYVSKDRPPFPAKVFPVYIPLRDYGGNSLEDLVYSQLFSRGKITDKELAPMFLEQGGLLIFLDGVNEVQNISDRQKLRGFVERFWMSNYICLSSQQSYPEIENIPKVELKTFSPENVCEFIRKRVGNKKTAENVIKNLTDEDYQLYSVPRDLEFAVEILNSGEQSLPKSRTALYKTTFNFIFAKWKKNGNMDAEGYLYQHAYTMIVQRDLAFDSVDSSHFKEVTTDLLEQKFLVRRENSYNFRHDLIRSYLASEYFYPRWKNLFEEIEGKPIDSNWLEMLKFSCENIEHPLEVKELVFEVLRKSIRKDVVKNLFEWLKANHPAKCKSWEKDFYAKYGELDFK